MRWMIRARANIQKLKGVARKLIAQNETHSRPLAAELVG